MLNTKRGERASLTQVLLVLWSPERPVLTVWVLPPLPSPSLPSPPLLSPQHHSSGGLALPDLTYSLHNYFFLSINFNLCIGGFERIQYSTLFHARVFELRKKVGIWQSKYEQFMTVDVGECGLYLLSGELPNVESQN